LGFNEPRLRIIYQYPLTEWDIEYWAEREDIISNLKSAGMALVRIDQFCLGTKLFHELNSEFNNISHPIIMKFYFSLSSEIMTNIFL
jgi:hypothetical protein